MHFYRSKSTVGSLKSVSMYLGGNRRWVPLLYVQCINCVSQHHYTTVKKYKNFGDHINRIKKKSPYQRKYQYHTIKVIIDIAKKKKHTNDIKPIE